MAHHTPVAPAAQAPIPNDPDIGRLVTVRPQALERVRRQMTHDLLPLTVDRLLSAIGIEPPALRYMTFKVTDDRVYCVHISAEMPLDAVGAPLVGQHVWAGRKLLVSALVPLRQRLEILLHEAWHAWRCTNGQIMDEEIIADQFSACASAFFAQFQAQGGEAALMAMEPADPDDLIEHDERWDTSAC